MKYLSDIAAKEMLWAVRANFLAEFSSWTETLDRVLALHDMARPGSPSHRIAGQLLRLHDWPLETDWGPELDERSCRATDDEELESQTGRRPSGDHPRGDEGDSVDRLKFISSARGLLEWIFHQYDVDPHPSVPHGHKRGSDHTKLDAYQGWVYDRSRQVHREPRRKMIDLWNDRKFRTFALTSIKYHLKNHPYHGGWSVANPMRLPRIR